MALHFLGTNKKFMVSTTFGVPIKSMKTYLDLPAEKQDAVLKNEEFLVIV